MIEFTIDQLLNFNIYLGYTKAIDSMFVYLRGKRLNFYIINLYLTIFFFKRFLSYLSLFLEKKGLFWIANVGSYLSDLCVNLRNMYLSLLEQKCRVYIWRQKYFSGMFANFKDIIFHPQIDWRFVPFPNSIVFFESYSTRIFCKEMYTLKFPTIGIIDTSTVLQKAYIFYQIPANEKDNYSKIFYYKLVFNFLLRNKLMEKLSFWYYISNL